VCDASPRRYSKVSDSAVEAILRARRLIIFIRAYETRERLPCVRAFRNTPALLHASFVYTRACECNDRAAHRISPRTFVAVFPRILDILRLENPGDDWEMIGTVVLSNTPH